ncbi:MAG: DUF5011 domain-containing protein [Bacteroidetes bacterium]|nr:DUF5011 domain-containing protein [Bacteroidota bacterium]
MGAFALSAPSSLSAQLCSGTPAYGSGNCTVGGSDRPGDLIDVTVKNKAGKVLYSASGIGPGATCASASAAYQGILNASSAFDVTAGEELTLEIAGGSWATGGWTTRVGVWIDANKDNSFASGENIIDPNNNSVGSTASPFTVKMPCFTSAGTSYMRFRGCPSVYTMTKNNGCGSGTVYYGNTFDLAINLVVPPPSVAGFIVPTGPNYEKTSVTFLATNPNNGADYTWTFDKADAVIQGKTPRGTARWDNPGTYDVKMLVDFCGSQDSITKTVKIITPTAAPNAEFIADNNEVEIYYNVQLFDLSDNGAYKWDWELKSPTGADDQTATNQNPVFTLNENGWYEVCLTAENGVGPSTKKCKSKYIDCTAPTQYYMGPSKEGASKNGTLFDNGGPTANYGNNRKPSIDYFKILPCGAETITLSFAELKLADAGDKMRIYDAGEADPSKEVTPKEGITSTNQAYWDTTDIVLTSGAGYITFETNGSGNDKGFILNWKSKLAPATSPIAKWATDFNPSANSVAVDFKNASSNTKGVPSYEWWIDQNIAGTGENYTEFFSTDGTYEVCLVAQTCNGNDTFCDNITIVTPSKPGYLDYTADNVRPNVLDVVSFTTKTDYANQFEWSIFPTSFSYMNGTSASSQNPQIKFLKGGAYTFTLKAWNSVGGDSATQKKLIKNKYVIVLDYCTPLVSLLTADVGINSVVLEDANGKALIDVQSGSGQQAYTGNIDNVYPPVLTFGASYDLTVERLTNSNNANFKAWVDWNIDGDFNDAGEEVLSSGSISGTSATATVKVPKLSQSFEGLTRLRVGASYDGFSNTPCGVNQVGEFEDYLIKLSNDNAVPVITLVGSDTVRVERGTSQTSCYAEVASSSYKALDPTEGDMTSEVVLKSDLDCTVPGVYSITFDLEDASGNKAVQRTRTVIVVLDRTAPVLTLNGNKTITIEQCDTYSELGAVATDAVDGNLTSAIQITGSVDATTVGDYTLVYTVKDAQGNTATDSRLVQVRDTKKPGIYRLNQRISDGATIDVQIGSVFVDEVYALDDCNGSIFVSKNPGFNGPVNNQVRATYPITYKAKDPSGNMADEDGYTINYRVDDYIAPMIELNTSDTVYHDVNEPYYSRNVTVTDNYYDNTKLSVVKVGKVDAYTLGMYEEKYTATDESGNTSTKSRFVKVVDRVAPTMAAPPVSVCVGTPFWAMSGLIVRDNYYSPTDLLPLVKVLSHNVNIWEAGVYYINYLLTDPSGNEAAVVSRSVYVQYPPNCQNTYLGVEELSLEEAVTVSPNPTTGKVTVAYSLNNSEPVQIEVTNALGAVVVRSSSQAGGFGQTDLNLGDFGNGIYFVRLSNQGQTTTKKVVVKN